MSTFAILVKSHAPDAPYVQRLLTSFHRHNADSIDLYLVVPDTDVPLFAPLTGPLVSLVPESDFSDHLVTEPLSGYATGYINQEIVKLAFWETGLADNYLCLDSDAEFIRDFRISDFMADDDTPYTFLSEDAELRVEPEYYAEHWQAREPRLRRIQQEIGLDEDRLLTVHGHAVFSTAVLRAFHERFLTPRNWDYADALAIAPLEPTWYSMWLQRDRTIPVIPREPVIKTFHNATQHLDYVLRGLTSDDVARGYVAVVVNSNYSRGHGVLSFGDRPAQTLASYVTAGELLRSMANRAWLTRGGRSPAS